MMNCASSIPVQVPADLAHECPDIGKLAGKSKTELLHYLTHLQGIYRLCQAQVHALIKMK